MSTMDSASGALQPNVDVPKRTKARKRLMVATGLAALCVAGSIVMSMWEKVQDAADRSH